MWLIVFLLYFPAIDANNSGEEEEVESDEDFIYVVGFLYWWSWRSPGTHKPRQAIFELCLMSSRMSFVDVPKHLISSCVALSIFVVFVWCIWGTPLWCCPTLAHMLEGCMASWPCCYLWSSCMLNLGISFSKIKVCFTSTTLMMSRGIKVMNLGVILNLREVCRVPLWTLVG